MTATPGRDVFQAIAHPQRRRLLDLLREREQPVHELARTFDMTRPAVSQHLKVLLDARLVSEHPRGREHVYRLEAQRLGEVRDWLDTYAEFWQQGLSRLGQHLERES